MKNSRQFVVIGLYALLVLTTFFSIGLLSEHQKEIITVGSKYGEEKSVSGNIVLALFLISVAATYFLPTIVAFARSHPVWLGVGLVNAAFGWTGVGWVTAFVWACGPIRAPIIIAQQSFPPPLPRRLVANHVEEDLTALARLREGGLITEEEFKSQRLQILNSLL